MGLGKYVKRAWTSRLQANTSANVAVQIFNATASEGPFEGGFKLTKACARSSQLQNGKYLSLIESKMQGRKEDLGGELKNYRNHLLVT